MAICSECKRLQSGLQLLLKNVTTMDNHADSMHSTIYSESFSFQLSGYRQVLHWYFICDMCSYRCFYEHDMQTHTKDIHTESADSMQCLSLQSLDSPVNTVEISPKLRRHAKHKNTEDSVKMSKKQTEEGSDETVLSHKSKKRRSKVSKQEAIKLLEEQLEAEKREKDLTEKQKTSNGPGNNFDTTPKDEGLSDSRIGHSHVDKRVNADKCTTAGASALSVPYEAQTNTTSFFTQSNTSSVLNSKEFVCSPAQSNVFSGTKSPHRSSGIAEKLTSQPPSASQLGAFAQRHYLSTQAKASFHPPVSTSSFVYKSSDQPFFSKTIPERCSASEDLTTTPPPPYGMAIIATDGVHALYTTPTDKEAPKSRGTTLQHNILPCDMSTKAYVAAPPYPEPAEKKEQRSSLAIQKSSQIPSAKELPLSSTPSSISNSSAASGPLIKISESNLFKDTVPTSVKLATPVEKSSPTLGSSIKSTHTASVPQSTLLYGMSANTTNNTTLRTSTDIATAKSGLGASKNKATTVSHGAPPRDHSTLSRIGDQTIDVSKSATDYQKPPEPEIPDMSKGASSGPLSDFSSISRDTVSSTVSRIFGDISSDSLNFSSTVHKQAVSLTPSSNTSVSKCSSPRKPSKPLKTPGIADDTDSPSYKAQRSDQSAIPNAALVPSEELSVSCASTSTKQSSVSLPATVQSTPIASSSKSELQKSGSAVILHTAVPSVGTQSANVPSARTPAVDNSVPTTENKPLSSISVIEVTPERSPGTDQSSSGGSLTSSNNNVLLSSSSSSPVSSADEVKNAIVSPPTTHAVSVSAMAQALKNKLVSYPSHKTNHAELIKAVPSNVSSSAKEHHNPISDPVVSTDSSSAVTFRSPLNTKQKVSINGESGIKTIAGAEVQPIVNSSNPPALEKDNAESVSNMVNNGEGECIPSTDQVTILAALNLRSKITIPSEPRRELKNNSLSSDIENGQPVAATVVNGVKLAQSDAEPGTITAQGMRSSQPTVESNHPSSEARDRLHSYSRGSNGVLPDSSGFQSEVLGTKNNAVLQMNENSETASNWCTVQPVPKVIQCSPVTSIVEIGLHEAATDVEVIKQFPRDLKIMVDKLSSSPVNLEQSDTRKTQVAKKRAKVTGLSFSEIKQFVNEGSSPSAESPVLDKSQMLKSIFTLKKPDTQESQLPRKSLGTALSIPLPESYSKDSDSIPFRSLWHSVCSTSPNWYKGPYVEQNIRPEFTTPLHIDTAVGEPKVVAVEETKIWPDPEGDVDPWPSPSTIVASNESDVTERSSGQLTGDLPVELFKVPRPSSAQNTHSTTVIEPLPMNIESRTEYLGGDAYYGGNDVIGISYPMSVQYFGSGKLVKVIRPPNRDLVIPEKNHSAALYLLTEVEDSQAWPGPSLSDEESGSQSNVTPHMMKFSPLRKRSSSIISDRESVSSESSVSSKDAVRKRKYSKISSRSKADTETPLSKSRDMSPLTKR